jgi:hypothetical protein
MFASNLTHTMVWALVAAWGLSAGWPLGADTRTGGSVAITAEVTDGGGGQSSGGAVVNDGSLGAVGDQSTGATVVVNGGYPAQIPVPTPPTAAVLLSFSASWLRPGEVTLDWQTGVEFDLLGFHVERQRIDGVWLRVNPGIIPAAGGGRPNRYSFVEGDVPPASQIRYRLLEVNLSGQPHVVGEALVQVGLQAGIALSSTGLTLSVQGAGGDRILVETTTDVAQGLWVPVAELSVDADGSGILQTRVEGESSARFYRVRAE